MSLTFVPLPLKYGLLKKQWHRNVLICIVLSMHDVRIMLLPKMFSQKTHIKQTHLQF